jgi:predicted permease
VVGTLVSALAPIVVVLGLGFLAGWHHDFNQQQASILNRMVMLYALPLSLFAGIMATPREVLFSNGAVFAWIAVGMVGGLGVTYAVSRFAFRRAAPVAALQALAIGGPAVPFVGTSVLATLFHSESSLAVAISSLLMNLVQVPFVMMILSKKDPAPAAGGRHAAVRGAGSEAPGGQLRRRPAGASAGGNAAAVAGGTGIGGRQANRWGPLLERLKTTAREPIVWAPILAFVLVVAGVRLPNAAHASLMLLGQATGGVALFASGAILYSLKVSLSGVIWINVAAKNLVLPAVVWGLMLLTGAGAQSISVVVVTLAIPTASIPVILAIQFRKAAREMASTLFVSTVTSLITMAAFILLTSP